jgi:hypothetical protein
MKNVALCGDVVSHIFLKKCKFKYWKSRLRSMELRILVQGYRIKLCEGIRSFYHSALLVARAKRSNLPTMVVVVVVSVPSFTSLKQFV